jgi:hypothetical protein
MRWPWQHPQVPTFTRDGTGRTPGLCERCDALGLVMLNGQQFFCWDHYCQEMALQRAAGLSSSPSKEQT